MQSNIYTLGVIIPCWNCAEYLHTTIECLISQTFADWKAFLVDDQSTDSTAEVIKKYALKDTRINYVCRNRAPKGAQACRNIGFELAEGAKFVVFFDSDDLFASYCFEQRVTFMQQHPTCDFAIFKAKTFRKSIFEKESLMFGVDFTEDMLPAMLNRSLPLVGWTNIYKRQSLIEHNIFWDEKLLSLQDSDYNIQSLVSDMRYMHAKDFKVDYFYRQVNDGISKKIKTKEHYESHLYLLNKTLNTVSQMGLTSDVVLQNNILIFYGMIRDNKESIKKLLQIRWLKKRKNFYLKMCVYILLGGRGKKYLFRKERKFSQIMSQKWQHAIDYNVVEFLKSVNEDSSIVKLEKMLSK